MATFGLTGSGGHVSTEGEGPSHTCVGVRRSEAVCSRRGKEPRSFFSTSKQAESND